MASKTHAEMLELDQTTSKTSNCMKLSVLMTTYNHEKYIAQAIESVLMQQVGFDYELVISEDCSTDNTRDIVINYQIRHPNKIRLLLREKNLGMMENAVQTFQACSGEYVAILDGDDYWTSPHKLQKQVDYLDRHQECTVCFHNALRFYEDGSQEPQYKNALDQKEISTLEDLWGGCFIAACSGMFRRDSVGCLPQWFVNMPSPDWPTYILAAQNGKIGYINEVMGAYRTHAGGVWSGMSRIQRLHQLVEFYRAIDAHLGFVHHKRIRVQLAKQYTYLALEYEKNRDLGYARKYALRCFRESPFDNQIPDRYPLKLLVRVYAPKSYKLMAGIRKWLAQMRA